MSYCDETPFRESLEKLLRAGGGGKKPGAAITQKDIPTSLKKTRNC